MSRAVIADTSFLVALLSRDDQYHPWAAQQAGSLPLPLTMDGDFFIYRKNGHQVISVISPLSA